MRTLALAIALGVGSITLAQQEPAPLSGPKVEETRIPGVEPRFGEGSMERQAMARPIPAEVFERAISRLTSERVEASVRLSPEQGAAIRTLRAEHEAAVRAFMETHQEEFRRARRAGAAIREAGDEAMEDRERLVEIVRRAEEIRRGAPDPSSLQKQVWAVLTEPQRAIVEEEVRRHRAEQDQREAERYAQRMMRELEAREAQPARPEVELHPLVAKFREDVMALPPAERAAVLRSLRQVMLQTEARPAAAARPTQEPRERPATKPAPTMDEVNVPPPDRG